MVAVVTTGDELVPAGQALRPGQIRDANIHALGAQVRAAGAMPLPVPRVRDTRGGGAGRAASRRGPPPTWSSPTAASRWATGTTSRRCSRSSAPRGCSGGVDPEARTAHWRSGLWRRQAGVRSAGQPGLRHGVLRGVRAAGAARMMGFGWLHRPLTTCHLVEGFRKDAADDDRTHFLRVVVTGDDGRPGGDLDRAPGVGDAHVDGARQRPRGGSGAMRARFRRWVRDVLHMTDAARGPLMLLDACRPPHRLPADLGHRPLQPALPVLHAGRRRAGGEPRQTCCATRRSRRSSRWRRGEGIGYVRLTGGEPLARLRLPGPGADAAGRSPGLPRCR